MVGGFFLIEKKELSEPVLTFFGGAEVDAVGVVVVGVGVAEGKGKGFGFGFADAGVVRAGLGFVEGAETLVSTCGRLGGLGGSGGGANDGRLLVVGWKR